MTVGVCAPGADNLTDRYAYDVRTPQSLDATPVRGAAKLAGVVTFIYTRCPLLAYCPLMDRRFAEVQRAVAADATLRGRVRLLSVSEMVNPGRPMPNRNAAALIGKIGSDSNDLFFIGDETGPVRVRGNGRLFLGINDDVLTDNSGNFRVVVYY